MADNINDVIPLCEKCGCTGNHSCDKPKSEQLETCELNQVLWCTCCAKRKGERENETV